MGPIQKVTGGAILLALGMLVPAPMAAAGDAERLDQLFADLAAPERSDWQRIEREIDRLWSRSGSAALDLLLRRGRAAIEDDRPGDAVEHLSALIEQADDFAEAYNTRASAWVMLGEYGLAIADIEQTLALNPRHFGALAGLGMILERMGETRAALTAYREAHALSPHRTNLLQAIARLERRTGEVSL